MGLWKFARIMTQIGILFFGCSEHDWCGEMDKELCEAILEDIVSSGNFGINDKSRKLQSKMIRNSKTRKIKEKSIARNVIANVNIRAKKKYPQMTKNPILLPIGWLGVGVEYAKWSHRNVGHKTMREIYNNAQKRQEMYAKLRLFENEMNEDAGE